MKRGIHPANFNTVIQGKDGILWVKRWPLGRSFLSLEVDILQHKLWAKSPFKLSKNLKNQVRLIRNTIDK